MALPVQIRTFSTRRDVPLLDVTTLHLGSKSWCLALLRSMSNTETTGLLGGTRNAASVWTILRTCDSVSVLVGNNWTGLAALVGNYSGSAHSWAVLENTTLGYQFCIDINGPGQGFRFVMTKIASPFSTGTNISAPISANEFQAGVYGGGLGAITPPIFAGTVGVQTYYFHYTTAADGQFFTLTNRLNQLNFNCFFAVQKTENAHVNDTDNVFMWMAPATEDARGTPMASYSISSPNITGRSADGLNVFAEASGGRSMSYGGSALYGSERKDVLRGQYPAHKVEIFSFSGVALNGHRGNFYDVWAVPLASGRIGQVYPSTAAPKYVVACDFLIPFVGAPPTL